MSPLTPLSRPTWLSRERWPFTTGTLTTPVGELAVTDAGHGPTLLFVHIGSWSFVWRDLLLALTPRYRCITLDAPGGGLSAHPRDTVTLRGATEAVGAVLDQLDLRSTTLVMHDVGGPAGLAAAGDRSARITGLVALNALGWRPTGAALRGMLAVMGSAPVRESGAALGWVARLSASGFGAGRGWTEQDRAIFLRGMDRAARRNTHRYLRALRTEDDLLRQAEDAVHGPLTALPLLTVFGSRNDPFGLARRWKQLYPTAEQHVIPGGNHYPMGDDPRTIAELMHGWHTTRVLETDQPPRSARR